MDSLTSFCTPSHCCGLLSGIHKGNVRDASRGLEKTGRPFVESLSVFKAFLCLNLTWVTAWRRLPLALDNFGIAQKGGE